MEGMVYQHYFLQPLDVRHRHYEVLRAVFVDGDSMQDAAQRFNLDYGTVRNWVSAFRRLLDADQRPPFSRLRSVVDQQSQPTSLMSRQAPLPTSKRYLWNQADD